MRGILEMPQYKNNSNYKTIIKQVGKHSRFDPRAGRKVDVGSYFRGQYIKKEKTISPKIVEKSFEEKTNNPPKQSSKKHRYIKYSKMIRIDTPENAEKSTKKLVNEFINAKNNEKKLRVARVAQYTANRIDAMLKRKKLSEGERSQLEKVSKIYTDRAKLIWMGYNSDIDFPEINIALLK